MNENKGDEKMPGAANVLALGLRFLVEILALAAMALWGFAAHEPLGFKLLFGLGLPVFAAAAWGVFRVDGDPNKAPVRVTGVLRLALEAVYFGIAVWCLFDAGLPAWGWALLALVVISYAVLPYRLAWLVRQ